MYGFYLTIIVLLTSSSTTRISILVDGLRLNTPMPIMMGFGNDLDKGFNILETASKLIPQGRIVSTAKEGWKFAWQVRRE